MHTPVQKIENFTKSTAEGLSGMIGVTSLTLSFVNDCSALFVGQEWGPPAFIYPVFVVAALLALIDVGVHYTIYSSGRYSSESTKTAGETGRLIPPTSALIYPSWLTGAAYVDAAVCSLGNSGMPAALLNIMIHTGALTLTRPARIGRLTLTVASLAINFLSFSPRYRLSITHLQEDYAAHHTSQPKV